MNNLNAAIEKHTQEILDAEKYIWQHPETGYKEFKTAAYMEKQFRRLGYDLTMADGITGFYTVVDTGRPGPEVLVLAELDSVLCPEHKDADPATGAVHACGHHAQCAAFVGLAAALKEPGVLDDLCGRIKLCVVPAEELLEIEYRTELKKQGKIKYFGGKSEFLYRGYFDGADIAFMVHTGKQWSVDNDWVGCMAKKITYKGVAAHAGGSPWNGCNALYAANCGLNAINALRETFRDSDMVRVHPIITNGGAIVNAIPEKVTLESYVRGITFDAIAEANHKVNRALCGAALSLGANVEISDTFGYAPMHNDRNLIALTAEAAKLAVPEHAFKCSNQNHSGSTDMGDLSCIMPSVQPYAGGAAGNAHGKDYEIVDPTSACVGSAKLQLTMLHLLLRNGAERAKKVIADFKPVFASKEEYFAYVDQFQVSGDRIVYGEGDTVSVNIQ